MTARVALTDITAWVETSKLGPSFTAIDVNLEAQISAEVLADLSDTYDTTLSIDSNTTPLLVKRIISMRYTAWEYYKLFGDNEDGCKYADMLMASADNLLSGIINGFVTLPDLPSGATATLNRLPGYYPTDESSALCPTIDDLSLGGPVFSMGRIW